jgi:hypothetical protein
MHDAAAACVPMSPPASQPSLGETGDEPPGMRRRLRSQSSCPTPVRRDHRRRSRGGALAAHRALVHGDAQPAPSGRSTRALRAGLRHRLTIRHGHRSGTARGPFLGTGRCPVSGERLAARPTRPADPPKPAGRPPKTGWPTPQIRPADRPNPAGPPEKSGRPPGWPRPKSVRPGRRTNPAGHPAGRGPNPTRPAARPTRPAAQPAGWARGCDLTLEQKSCAKGGVRTAKRGVRTEGVRTVEKVLEHC